MALAVAVGLTLLVKVSAGPRAAVVVAGEELIQSASPPTLFTEKLQMGASNLGRLEILGSCCGAARGKAFQVVGSINANTLYGSTSDVSKVIFKDGNCSAIDKQTLDVHSRAECDYFYIYENKAYAHNDFAANCVPATICNQNVVGMTKGLVATYGVILQILQQNLGSLYWLGEGQTKDCFKAMNQINMGNTNELLVTKPDLVVFGHVVNYKTVMEVPGMKRLGAIDSLSNCKNDTTTGYLFVHENLYWSKRKQELDLGEFTEFKQAEEQKKLERAKKKAMEAAEKAEKAQKEEAEREAKKQKAENPLMAPMQEQMVTAMTAPKLMDEVNKIGQAPLAPPPPPPAVTVVTPAPKSANIGQAPPVPVVPPPAVAVPVVPPPAVAVVTPAPKPAAKTAKATDKAEADAKPKAAAQTSKTPLPTVPAAKPVQMPSAFAQQVDNMLKVAHSAKAGTEQAAKVSAQKATDSADKAVDAAKTDVAKAAEAAKANFIKAAADVKSAVTAPETVSTIASRRLSADFLV
ncbi:unnamed protein product [Symbiodinium pilosum]|uniref:Uncharacterized protein n=1 Tax=Symbiodinium pilosum TaxID=2952 RepID=A0A812IS98_SYMPI|nr:unnamed protein product [Symbiodinium pilosum]